MSLESGYIPCIYVYMCINDFHSEYIATQIYFWSEVGTTSGRKLRRGPEMEPRRVDRGQWRCSQYNFPIASIVFLDF